MPPKLKIWTSELEFQLIHEVRSRPILWDISLADYRRNDLKEVHWEEVANKLGHNISSEVAKKRFINMRDTFMENNKKVKESKRSGTGAENIYKPKWPLFQSLTFLLKTVEQAESISNLNIAECNTTVTDSVGSTSSSLTIPPLDIIYDENSQAFMLVPETQSQSTVPVETPASEATRSCFSSSPDFVRPSSAPPVCDNDTPGLYKKRGIKRAKDTPLSEEALKLMHKVVNEPVAPPVEDAAEKFGAFVASKLREMDQERRNICESKIVKVLYE
ncbi:Transcription factor Adf-1 [Frankliniella fusca]|uniref:Transcription factor Adf-1 n=1 Tax=Frankliniella fusca TaxID=407009 RepID=A0AAE1HJC5_9NEOP|nr:Transcription factor Adf-1 [Frankliniella fusca]